MTPVRCAVFPTQSISSKDERNPGYQRTIANDLSNVARRFTASSDERSVRRLLEMDQRVETKATARAPHWEPSLRDMLADPIVRRLMARDGVHDNEILALYLMIGTKLENLRP